MPKNKSKKSVPAPLADSRERSSSAQVSRPAWRLLLFQVLVFEIIAGVFLPAIRNDFFYWYGDDPGYVTENAHVRSGLTLDGVKWAFRNIDLGNWHPLTWLSHMIDCEIYGLKS